VLNTHPNGAKKSFNYMKKSLIWLVQGYRKFISPLFPPSCRFTPTCSQYAIEAIDRFGTIKGSYLATLRILRCNPFHPGGYDPVPALAGKSSDDEHPPCDRQH
jgi:uncharacterized protein